MAVTAVMHLLFLVAFSWMLVEGLLLWSKVVVVSMRPGPRMALYYTTGWGDAPLLPAPALFSSLLHVSSRCPTPSGHRLHLGSKAPTRAPGAHSAPAATDSPGWPVRGGAGRGGEVLGGGARSWGPGQVLGAGPGLGEYRLRGMVRGTLVLLLGVPVAIVAVTLALSPHDYVAAGHCWLNVHTDIIWAFVGPVLFVLTVSGVTWGPRGVGRSRWGRGRPSHPLTPGLQANTCILVRVVVVTVASARRRARMLSPRPCLQEQVRIQTW